MRNFFIIIIFSLFCLGSGWDDIKWKGDTTEFDQKFETQEEKLPSFDKAMCYEKRLRWNDEKDTCYLELVTPNDRLIVFIDRDWKFHVEGRI